MTQSVNQARRNEGGFTLVELAIVMIIIGLLIGGILKGQELITNARVSSTVAQVKAVESGISGFRDKYASLPGDINNPSTRLPNCAAGTPCGVAGTGGTINNGLIEPQDPGAAAAITTEVGLAFIQLGAAGLVGGIQPSAAALGAGTSNPTTPLGSAWAISSFNGTATSVVDVTGVPAGVYMLAKGAAVGAVAVADDAQVMTPSNAATIDTKLDDGRPVTGSVRAAGSALAATACASGAAGAEVYNESLGGKVCGILARVQ